MLLWPSERASSARAERENNWLADRFGCHNLLPDRCTALLVRGFALVAECFRCAQQTVTKLECNTACIERLRFLGIVRTSVERTDVAQESGASLVVTLTNGCQEGTELGRDGVSAIPAGDCPSEGQQADTVPTIRSTRALYLFASGLSRVAH